MRRRFATMAGILALLASCQRVAEPEFEADIQAIRPLIRPDTQQAAIALAKLPLDIRGFGPVKQANAAKAAKRREELLAVIKAPQTRAAAE